VNEVDLGWTALAGLSAVSVLFTVLALLVVRTFSDQAAVLRAKSLAQAHLLEFRLYDDDLRSVFRAQRELLVANFRLIRLLLPSVLVLAIPGVVLFGLLDACYGRAKLVVGEPAVVTVQLAADDTNAKLAADQGIAVETEPVRVAAERQLVWRVRPVRAVSSALRLNTPEGVVTKSISAGHGVGFVSERRTDSLLSFVLQPVELPLSHPGVRWISVQYPKATVMGMHWVIWFLLISLAAALLLKRPLRTAF
jgi:hypothetical protein